MKNSTTPHPTTSATPTTVPVMPFIGPTRPFKPPALTPCDINESRALLKYIQKNCSLFESAPLTATHSPSSAVTTPNAAAAPTKTVVTASTVSASPIKQQSPNSPMGPMKCKSCVSGADSKSSGSTAPTSSPADSLASSERLLQRTLAAVLSRRILGVPAACAAAAAASIHPIPEMAFAPQPLGPEETEHTFMESVRTIVETSGMVFLNTAFNPPNVALPTCQDGNGVSLACHNHDQKEDDESDSEEGKLLATFDAVLLHNAHASIVDTAPPAAPTLREIQRLCCSRSPPPPPPPKSSTPSTDNIGQHQTSPQPSPSSLLAATTPSSWSKGLLYGSSGLGAATADSDIDVLLLLRPDFSKSSVALEMTGGGSSTSNPASPTTATNTCQPTGYEVYQRTLSIRDDFMNRFPIIIETIFRGLLFNILDLIVKDVLVVWEMNVRRLAWESHCDQHLKETSTEAISNATKSSKVAKRVAKSRKHRHFKPTAEDVPLSTAAKGMDDDTTRASIGMKRERDDAACCTPPDGDDEATNAHNHNDDSSSSSAPNKTSTTATAASSLPKYSQARDTSRLQVLTLEEGILLLGLTTETLLTRASNSLFGAAASADPDSLKMNSAAKVLSSDCLSSSSALRSSLSVHTLDELLLPVAASASSISLARIKLSDHHRKRLMRAKGRLYSVAASVVGLELGLVLKSRVGGFDVSTSSSSDEEGKGKDFNDATIATSTARGGGSRHVFFEQDDDPNDDDKMAATTAKRASKKPSSSSKHTAKTKGSDGSGGSSDEVADEYRRRLSFHSSKIRSTLLELLRGAAEDTGPVGAPTFLATDPTSSSSGLHQFNPVVVTTISAARVPVLKLKVCGVHTDIILGILDTHALEPPQSFPTTIAPPKESSHFVEDTESAPGEAKHSPTKENAAEKEDSDSSSTFGSTKPVSATTSLPLAPFCINHPVDPNTAARVLLLPLLPFSSILRRRNELNRAAIEMLLCSTTELEALGGHAVQPKHLRAIMPVSSISTSAKQHPFFEVLRVMNQVPVHGMRQCLNGVRTITCIPSLLPDSNECGMYLQEGLRQHNGLRADYNSASCDLTSILQLLNSIKGLVHNTAITPTIKQANDTKEEDLSEHHKQLLQTLASPLVPHGFHFRSVYQPALRYVKRWASALGIYGNLYSFLPGVSVAVMVARACQIVPTVAVTKLLAFFFAFFERILSASFRVSDQRVEEYVRNFLHVSPSSKQHHQHHDVIGYQESSSPQGVGGWIDFMPPSPIFLSKSLFTQQQLQGGGGGSSSSSLNGFRIQGMHDSYNPPQQGAPQQQQGSNGGSDALPVINPAYPFTVTSHTAGRTCVAALQHELQVAKQYLSVKAVGESDTIADPSTIPLIRLLEAATRHSFLTVHNPMLRSALSRRCPSHPGSSTFEIPLDFNKRKRLLTMWMCILDHHKAHTASTHSPNVTSLYSALKDEPADRQQILLVLKKLTALAPNKVPQHPPTRKAAFESLKVGWEAILKDAEETEVKARSEDPGLDPSLAISSTYDGLLCVDALYLPNTSAAPTAPTPAGIESQTRKNAKSKCEFEMWAGFIESRFRMLVYMAEGLASSNMEELINSALDADAGRVAIASPPPPPSHSPHYKGSKRERIDVLTATSGTASSGGDRNPAGSAWVRHVCEAVFHKGPSSSTANTTTIHTKSNNDDVAEGLKIHLIGMKPFAQRLDRQVSVASPQQQQGITTSYQSGACGTSMLGLRFMASCNLTTDPVTLSQSRVVKNEIGSHGVQEIRRFESEIEYTNGVPSPPTASSSGSAPKKQRFYWRPSLKFLHANAHLVEAEIKKLVVDFNAVVESSISKPQIMLPVVHADASTYSIPPPTVAVPPTNPGGFVREPGMNGPYHRLLLVPEEFKRSSEISASSTVLKNIEDATCDPVTRRSMSMALHPVTPQAPPEIIGQCTVCGSDVHKAIRKKRRGGTKRSDADVAAVAAAAERASGAWQLAQEKKWEARLQEVLSGMFVTVSQLLTVNTSTSAPFSDKSRYRDATSPQTIFKLLFKQPIPPPPPARVPNNNNTGHHHQLPTATLPQPTAGGGIVKLPLGIEVHQYSTAALVALYKDCLAATSFPANTSTSLLSSSTDGAIPYDLYRLLIPKELMPQFN